MDVHKLDVMLKVCKFLRPLLQDGISYGARGLPYQREGLPHEIAYQDEDPLSSATSVIKKCDGVYSILG